MIPYGRQSIDEEEVHAVVEVLGSDFLTQGPKIEEFESALAGYCGAKYAVAVANGTAALHLATVAAGVEPGDTVITSAITFLASSNCVIYAGGRPDFADIEAATVNIDLDQLGEKLKQNPRVKGIIPVYMGGLPPAMEAIYRLAREYNLWIIEDACHALGGEVVDSSGRPRKIGGAQFADMTVFSFHPVKQITTGEGGAILTNSSALNDRLRLLRTHGMTREPSLLGENHGNWYYEMQELGYNYRITDLQAALGIVQLTKCDRWVDRRLEIVQAYDAAFADVPQVSHQLHPAGTRHSYHLYISMVDNRKNLYDYLREQEIFCQVHYIPVPLQPYYRQKYGYKKGDFPVAEGYYQKALSLPLYASLTDEKQALVIDAVKQYYA